MTIKYNRKIFKILSFVPALESLRRFLVCMLKSRGVFAADLAFYKKDCSQGIQEHRSFKTLFYSTVNITRRWKPEFDNFQLQKVKAVHGKINLFYNHVHWKKSGNWKKTMCCKDEFQNSLFHSGKKWFQKQSVNCRATVLIQYFLQWIQSRFTSIVSQHRCALFIFSNFSRSLLSQSRCLIEAKLSTLCWLKISIASSLSQEKYFKARLCQNSAHNIHVIHLQKKLSGFT